MILSILMYQSWDACILMRFIFYFGKKLRSVGGCNKNALFEEWSKLQNWCNILKVAEKIANSGLKLLLIAQFLRFYMGACRFLLWYYT